MRRAHKENHVIDRIGWLRAAVLGANDGIISTGCLIVGVAAASTSAHEVAIAGIAGLVAGALSMAAGEYVSVSSQADTEAADLNRERRELADDPVGERDELAGIYRKRGLEPALSGQVADQLMARDALKAHARDELGMSDQMVARPIQAALTSALTFALGAAMPVAITLLAPTAWISIAVSAGSLVCLAALGAIGALIGGAGFLKPTIRVTFWGAFAMAATAAIGALIGKAV
ncbi:MAG: VIT family protein [Ancalomicrobiaceae bacterium]|nr:VIT family protein [Ancalomicrobiaceae bacterium]